MRSRGRHQPSEDDVPPGSTRHAAGGDLDEPSFEEFVVARSSALLRLAYLLTRDRSLADDLLQTALTKVWPRWSRITGSPEQYVRRVLVNTYTTWWRRKWRAEVPTDDLPERGVSGGYAEAETSDAIRTALGRLPPRQRAVVVLRYFEELSEAETATAMNCSRGNVKSQLSRALAKMRIDPALVDAAVDEDGRQR